ncbi:MAG: hypothetical protein JWN70_4579 [Planctomycetaceae bacterium]|nr:hypothetical protein [Planctomycetaceae bacterium]
MSKSLQQVCATYLQCWVQWFVILGYFGLCLAAVFAGESGSYGEWGDVSPKPSHPDPKVVVEQNGSLDQSSRDARSIDWTAPQPTPPQAVPLQPFPNLKTLEIRGALKSVEELHVLRAMPNLESLTLASMVPPDSLQIIGEVRSLQYLSLTKVENNPALSKLRQLAQLQILDLSHVDGYSRVLDEICQLPNLHTLVLPGQSAATFQAAEWERLRTLPRLQRLYLRGTQTGPREDQIEIKRVQQVLPRIQVRPAEVSRRRSWTWNAINSASALIWAALVVQLHTQFSHAGSRVIPNYSRDHLIVAVSVMCLTTFAHVMILWNRDVSLLASLAASLFIPGMSWWLVAITMWLSNDQNLARRLNPTTALLVFWIYPLSGSSVMDSVLGNVDWFLQGEQPVLALGLVVLCVISPLLVFRRLPRLHLVYSESESGVPLFSLDLDVLRNWNQNVESSKRRTKQSWLTPDHVARLDLQLAQPKPHSLSHLWIAGNGTNGLDLVWGLLRTGLVMAVVLYMMLGSSRSDSNRSQISVLYWAPLAAMWLDIGMLSGLVAVWRGRYSTLGYESLRPASRREFVRQLFRAVGRDLVPPVVLHLLLTGVLVGTLAAGGLPPLFIPVALCYCLFHGLAIYAGILLMMAVRGEMQFGLLMVVTFMMMYFAANQVTSVLSAPENWQPVWAIVLFIAGSVLAALSILGLKQYWEDLELA